MSRPFTKVSPQVWRSERFRDLPDDSAKLLYLYLLSSGHQNSIGCYFLPPAYACADLGWDRITFDQALTALIDSELVEADEATQEILILRWFKHNPPTNDSHLMGVQRLIENIESAPLCERADTELDASFPRGTSRTDPPWGNRMGRKAGGSG